MADLTHAKLAHNLVADHGADQAARAQVYATLAVADALDRIATVLERYSAAGVEIETFQSGPLPE